MMLWCIFLYICIIMNINLKFIWLNVYGCWYSINNLYKKCIVFMVLFIKKNVLSGDIIFC